MSLLIALADRGVHDFVVSPGSRSQALALAAAELERAGMARIHVRIDERDSAFLALGLALGSSSHPTARRPAAVITTSGSAVANLMPAVVEASRTGIPMLLLTADRPESMRETGANQTLNHQAEIFANYARFSYDVAVGEYSKNPMEAAACFARDIVEKANFGPVHANIQFVEPLSGDHSPVEKIQARIREIKLRSLHTTPSKNSQRTHTLQISDEDEAKNTSSDQAHFLANTIPALNDVEKGNIHASTTLLNHIFHPDKCLLIAGFNADTDVVEMASRAGVPIIAEITSGARKWHCVADYRRWLREGADGRRICIVTGLPNLSREAWSFTSREDVQLFAVASADHEYFSPHHRATRIYQAVFNPDENKKRLLDSIPSGSPDCLTDNGAFEYIPTDTTHDFSSNARHFPLENIGSDSAAKISELDFASASPISTFIPTDTSSCFTQTGASPEIPPTHTYSTVLSRDTIISLVWDSSRKDDAIYMAASHMVRVADTCIGASPIPVYSHRGLAGIDGTIAAASGVALSRAKTLPSRLSSRSSLPATSHHFLTVSQDTPEVHKEQKASSENSTANNSAEYAPPQRQLGANADKNSQQLSRNTPPLTRNMPSLIEETNIHQHPSPILRLIIGDLAFAHDIGGLLQPDCEERPPMQIIVVNDQGGSIFANLEVANSDPYLYERVVRTPQPLNIAKSAEAYSWEYSQAHTYEELSAFLHKRKPGIIEIRLEE